MLQVEEIHTYYGESYVLQGVSLGVRENSVAAVLGRNGVGKTTLIRSIMGFTPPRRGRIIFRGEDITGRPPYVIARMGIGLVPQGRRVFSSLTVRENLEVARRSRGGASEASWDAEKLFTSFPKLRERSHHRAGDLSGGEQQMLATARALMGNPSCLLLDEPSEGLAPLVVRELGFLLDELKEMGVAILLVEQNLGFALKHAGAAYIMSKGKVVYHASSKELSEDAEVQSRYLGV